MITNERERLDAIEQDEMPRFVVWLNGSEVRRNLMIYQPLSTAQEEKWYEETLRHKPSEQAFNIDVKDDVVWRHTGNRGFFDLNPIDRSAKIGIFIDGPFL